MFNRMKMSRGGAAIAVAGERRSWDKTFLRTLRLESGDKAESDANARGWRRMCFVVAVLLALSEVGRFSMEHRGANVVVIDHDIRTGRYVTMGPVRGGDSPAIPDRKVAIGKFFTDLYEISSAPLKDQKRRSFAHAAGGTQASEFVRDFWANGDTSPFYAKGHRGVSIEGYDVKSDSVFDLTFTVQPLTDDDRPSGSAQRFSAHVELTFVPDMSEQDLWDNPERLLFTVVRVTPAPLR